MPHASSDDQKKYRRYRSQTTYPDSNHNKPITQPFEGLNIPWRWHIRLEDPIH
jgi:hypothetical protein